MPRACVHVAEIFEDEVEGGGQQLTNDTSHKKGEGRRGTDKIARARTIASISATASMSVAVT